MTTEVLTREQILSMPAGPEMNALVAERVMKWRRSPDPFPGWLPTYERATIADIIMPGWSPSTDIAAGMEVLEYLRPFKHILLTGYWGGPWECELTEPSTEWRAQAEQLPLAICRAALLTTLED
jgi:hypothetical protein